MYAMPIYLSLCGQLLKARILFSSVLSQAGKEDKEAADKFKDIAEAYQVLSDPELRHKYDVEGKDGLSADRTDVNGGPNQVDPAILFAFLFGSDKFGDYLGRLAMATSALVADSPKIGQKEAGVVQQRRITRLAIKLADRLKIWVEEDCDGAKAIWESAATDLGEASYGAELVHLIGKVYNLSAHQFLGATDSGVGMPSIAKWAKVRFYLLCRLYDVIQPEYEWLKCTSLGKLC